MFCLECGAEMVARAQACPVCGRVYGERERSVAEPHPNRPALVSAHASPSMGRSAASAPASGNTSVVEYAGAAPSLPRDLPGRFVLATALGLAADLLLPWVSVNGENVTPASFSAPVVVVVALLAAATLPVFTTSLRMHPIWSALPLIIGAFCAGIAGAIWLVLAPLVQILATSFNSYPSNLSVSPQAGLYLFLIGSAVLLASGQKMLTAVHKSQLAEARHDAIHALRARQASSESAAPSVASTQPPTVVQTPAVAVQEAPGQPTTPTVQAAISAIPAAPEPPVAPVLPGSEAWHQAPAAPSPVRTSPGSGWGKPRGPQRLR